MTHGIVGRSVHPKCELDIPCVHYDVGNMIITDVSHLPAGKFNKFSLTRLQKKGWTLTGNAEYINTAKGGSSMLFNKLSTHPREHCTWVNSPQKGGAM
jgi:hypothetical protein